jgi:diguanylate cyclase (GGDEF)-like protein
LLFGNATAANMTVVIAAWCLVLLMRNEPESGWVIIWASVITLACGIRLRILAQFRREVRNPEAIEPLGRRYIASTLLVGIAWGFLGLFFYLSDQVMLQVFIYWLIIGAVTVAVPVLSSVMAAFFAYIAPMLLGLILGLLFKENLQDTLMAIMIGIYGGLVTKTAINTNRHLRQSLALQYRNRDLIGELNAEIAERKKAQHELKKHGETLESLVAERTRQLLEINRSLKIEISERERAEDNLHYLAHHDPLTSLPNRLLLDARLQHSIQHARRAESQVAVLFLDLDNFKHINDSLGHDVGDQLLSEVGGRLSHCVREDDTVARLGGDEFVIIMQQANDKTIIESMACKVMDALQQEFLIRKHSLFISTSIGICVFPIDSKDSEKLIGYADAAMYKAKAAGRGNFQFFTPDLSASAYDRVVLESHLREAMENQELVLYYQPQVAYESGEIVGMEALIRWDHPELGLLTPDRFLQVAEESGLIIPIGEFVLNAACRQICQWRKAGYAVEYVAVNLSGLQIYDKNLVSMVQQALQDTGCEPQWLELEITESFIMQKAGQSIEALHRLRDLGISFAIDDFGTGYSSLSYLKRLPVNTLKIDKSFIRDLEIDSNDMAIVQAIIALAKSLALSVTAEGVETRAQESVLTELGCDTGQGYVYSKPKSAETITDLLQLHAGNLKLAVDA